MLKSFKLTPPFFLISEFFILSPSILLLIGIFLSIFSNSFLIRTINESFAKFILVAFVMPFSGGFLSYHYLERYGPQGMVRKITKFILSYSILEIGIVSALLFLR